MSGIYSTKQPELSQLNDVNTVGVSNQDVLQYNNGRISIIIWGYSSLLKQKL